MRELLFGHRFGEKQTAARGDVEELGVGATVEARNLDGILRAR